MSILGICFIGCMASKKQGNLSHFTINHIPKNKSIINRIPDYGINGKDGCIEQPQLSLKIHRHNGEFYKGLVYDQLSKENLPFASILLVNSLQDTLYLNSDNDGLFQIQKSFKASQIQINYIGYRPLNIIYNF